MELEDCALPLLKGVVCTTDPKESFKNADVAILVGAMPRKQGMERKDLLKANATIFKEQGLAMNEVAKKDIKVREERKKVKEKKEDEREEEEEERKIPMVKSKGKIVHL